MLQAEETTELLPSSVSSFLVWSLSVINVVFVKCMLYISVVVESLLSVLSTSSTSSMKQGPPALHRPIQKKSRIHLLLL